MLPAGFRPCGYHYTFTASLGRGIFTTILLWNLYNLVLNYFTAVAVSTTGAVAVVSTATGAVESALTSVVAALPHDAIPNAKIKVIAPTFAVDKIDEKSR